jgi:hypothetical protein
MRNDLKYLKVKKNLVVITKIVAQYVFDLIIKEQVILKRNL